MIIDIRYINYIIFRFLLKMLTETFYVCNRIIKYSKLKYDIDNNFEDTLNGSFGQVITSNIV